MRNLYEDFVWFVEIGKKRYSVYPYFNRILQIYDLQKEAGMTESDVIMLQFDILTNGKYSVDLKTASKVLEITFKKITGFKNKKEASSKKYYDFSQDAFLIYSAFYQAYGIDLNKERDKLHYQAFIALFSCIPKETRFSQIIGIRSCSIPKANKYNTEKIQELIRLKNEWALEVSQEEREENLQKALWSMYEALLKKAGDNTV
jgi:hypothetical protein